MGGGFGGTSSTPGQRKKGDETSVETPRWDKKGPRAGKGEKGVQSPLVTREVGKEKLYGERFYRGTGKGCSRSEVCLRGKANMEKRKGGGVRYGNATPLSRG